MYREKCLIHFRKFRSLLEEDCLSLKCAIKGEVLEEYQKVIRLEEQLLEQEIRLFKIDYMVD